MVRLGRQGGADRRHPLEEGRLHMALAILLHEHGVEFQARPCGVDGRDAPPTDSGGI